MKVVLYVDWEDQVVYTPAELNRVISADMRGAQRDADLFNKFLQDNYNPLDLYHFTEEQRQKAYDKFKKQCETAIKYDWLESENKVQKIEIEIAIER